VNEWAYVDLTSLGSADSLQFFLSSTDVGIFGMNTPAYFCLDNFTTSDGITAVENVEETKEFTLSPNPANDFVYIKNSEVGTVNYQIFDNFGSLVKNGSFTNENRIDVSFLPKGMYVMNVEKESELQSQVFVKQ